MKKPSSGRRVPRTSHRLPSEQRTLTKRDVETLLANYDADPVGALTTCLRLLDAPESLVSSIANAPLETLDQMVKDLVEWRRLSDTQRQ